MSETLQTAARMIYASICAYQIHTRDWEPGPDDPTPDRTVEGPDGAYYYDVMSAWQDKVGFIKTAAEGYVPRFVASGDDLINAGFVGALKNGKAVISLRGTLPPTFDNDDIIEWIRDWAQDADIIPKPWPYLDAPDGRSIHVSCGFSDAAVSLWGFLKQALREVMAETDISGVIVTGHSKGAAMTFLIATMVAADFPEFKDRIEVYAFAPPVTGDTAFQAAYKAAGLDASTHRYQSGLDLVPFVPLWTTANIFKAAAYDPPGHKSFWQWLKDLFLDKAWTALGKKISRITDGGYSAVGDFTYFDTNHHLIEGAIVQDTALPAVAQALDQFEVKDIAAAHSATDSYLPSLLPYYRPDGEPVA